MKRDLDFIVAMTRERVIGRDNTLPWHLPEDLKRFKAITQNQTVIMGRKTYESMGKPLPKRKNIVLTRDSGYRIPGVTVCLTLDDAVAQAEGTPFVIGGSEIFSLAMPRLRRLYLTKIFESFPGDTFFPPMDLSEFRLEEESEVFQKPFPYQYQNWVHVSV